MDNQIRLQQTDKPVKAKGISILWIILGTIIVTAGVTYWAISTYIYAKDFKPVVLKQKQQQQLDQKLMALGYQPDNTAAYSRHQDKEDLSNEFDASGRLKPQKYSEANGERDLSFSERELNSLLASNTDMAKKLAIDLSQDLISARILIPLDPYIQSSTKPTLHTIQTKRTISTQGKQYQSINQTLGMAPDLI